MKLKIPKLKVNRITAEQRQIDVLEADVQFTTAASKKKSKALWWSIRSHSQKTEAGFNLIDETDKNAKGLGWARLIARVLAKARLTRQWQAERRAVHEVKTPRKTPEQVDEDEEKGMVSKRPRLVYTAKACRMAVAQVLAHCREHYSASTMSAIRKVRRPHWYRTPDGQRAMPKSQTKKLASEVYITTFQALSESRSAHTACARSGALLVRARAAKSVCVRAAKSDHAAKSGAGFRQVSRGRGALNTRAIYSLTHVRA